jgi:hypothetical protein
LGDGFRKLALGGPPGGVPGADPSSGPYFMLEYTKNRGKNTQKALKLGHFGPPCRERTQCAFGGAPRPPL